MSGTMDRTNTPLSPPSTNTTSPAHRYSRHKRSYSGPISPPRPSPAPPIPSSSSSTATNIKAHRMQPGSLRIPPTLVGSNLPADRELLQRWSSSNTPSGTPPPTSQRQPLYPKRHASFDSPREVPLPSPSLTIASFSPGGMLTASGNPLYNKFSSGATPSSTSAVSSQTVKPTGTSSRLDDMTSDYFPVQPLRSSSPSRKTALSSSSTSSSLDSGSGSTSSSSKSRPSQGSGYLCQGGQFSVFEEDESPRNGSGSDWTDQTSPSPSLLEDVSSGRDQEQKAPTAPASDLEKALSLVQSPSQFEPGDAVLGSNIAMTQSLSPAQPPCVETENAVATSVGTGARTTTLATPIFPYSRPYSLPDAPLRAYSATQKHTTAKGARDPLHRSFTSAAAAHGHPRIQMPPPNTVAAAEWPDRRSSASLPLPTQIPFHVLPKAGLNSAGGGRDAEDGFGMGGLGMGIGRMRVVDREAWIAGDAHADRVRSAHMSEVGSGMSYHQSLRSHQMDHYPYQSQQPGPSSSGSSSSGSLRSADPSIDAHFTDQFSENGSTSQASSHLYGPSSISEQRPVSPFRAPQPPQRPLSSPSTQISPPSTLGRSLSHSLIQASTEVSSIGAASASVYPAPEPPTILAPSVVSPGPFLSHAPPPPDSWIEVETTPREYKLVVRLPGFRRDGITLATKRRRILHVVADSWENGGGHFERRISFGYDADLVQVRAEFDGEMLRISIPRRLPPVQSWSQPRPGPIGRSG